MSRRSRRFHATVRRTTIDQSRCGAAAPGHSSEDATMHAEASIPHLREIIVFLVAAGIVLPLVQRLRVNPVLGYLAVGGAIGPFGLGLLAADVPALARIVIADLEGVRNLAELGIVFLLFTIGLEVSLDRLWAMRRLVFGLGALQVCVTGAAIAAIALAFGNSVPAATVFGAALALSSTAIAVQILVQARRLATPLGRASFAILLTQDLAVVPILFLVGMLAAEPGAGVAAELAAALAKAGLAIAGIYAAGRLVLRPALHVVAQARSREMFMAAILLVVLGTAMLTAMAGLSMALGAFLAGLLLAETEFRHEIEVDLEPFKGLMLGLFFVSVGMGIDWRLVAEMPVRLLASVAGLILLKAGIVAALCRAFGLPRHTALEAGLLLGQAGEFAFIVVGMALTLGLVDAAAGQFMLIVAGLSMLATPPVAALARRVASRLERGAAPAAPATEIEPQDGHVVIAGFGRVGRVLAATLQAEAVPYLALDTDAAAVARARAEGLPVFYGDVSRLDMLARAHVGEASAIVLTMDDFAAAERILRGIRLRWTNVPVFVRARDTAHARLLIAAGASSAVPETVEASLQLAGRVLEGLGVGEDIVRRRLDHQRTLDAG
jgi:CPA2 family monovalent cation:H+ antiporter-2